MRRSSTRVLVALALSVSAGACAGGSKTQGSGGTTGSGGTLESGQYTYLLSESPAGLRLWTTPATHKLTVGDRPPTETKSGLLLAAAKNEFEPAQLVIGPASGSVTVSWDAFSDLGAGARFEVDAIGYEQGWAEHLTPLSSGASITLSTSQGTGLWLTVYVPVGATAGDHSATLHLTPAGGKTVDVPVRLHVFGFALPNEIHFDSQFNLSISDRVGSGTVDQAKTLLYEHRFTPTSVTWPSGFGYNITWDSSSSPTRCTAFYDESDQAPQYSIGQLAPRYMLGTGWNGVGFPSSQVLGFVDNSTPRPDTFCGVARGDAYGTTAYNTAWSKYLTALDGYLVAHGLAARAYYYVQNEPQGPADYQLAAALCRLTRAAAPHLRIAISEEPKPEIAEDAGGACGYDIWIAHVRAYQQPYAWQRQTNNGETVWFYSLDQDPDPYFNPTRVDTQGMHERIIPWAGWAHRIRGWAYYDAGRFFDGTRPTVRAELLREGWEDYEYLYLANGNAYPVPGQKALADATALSVASSMTSWNKDADALMAVRYELGRYIEGSRTDLPVLQADTGIRPRGAYYLNFQDPAGKPTANPLVVNGKTYLKIGWGAYDAKLGYGWSGENIANPSIALYGYDDVAGFSELEKSYVYDDYGRDNLFEFAIAPGKYQITAAVGRPAHGYPNDPHNLSIEGQKVVDDEVTTDAAPVITKTVTLDVNDGSLSLVVGGRSASTGNYAYTFLDYVNIEPAP